MEFNHQYHEGMDKDTSKMLYSNKRIFEAKNFKITTSGGLSSLAFETEKGNRLDFSIPDTYGVYRVYLETGDLTINGEVFTIDSGTDTIQGIYDSIVASPLNIGTDLNVFNDTDSILLFGLDDLTVTSTNTDMLEEVVPNLSNLRIIHMDSYQNKLILFTLSSSSSNNGQIWEVAYNEETNLPNDVVGGLLVPSVHLKYNNQLNFNLDHYIRKSIVRYENDKLCRIYFTDFYNPARSFNLLDVDGYAVNPSDLDFVSDVSFTKPIIQDIGNGGAIPTGSMVQFAYTLTKGGKETVVSPVSDLLPVYTADDQTDLFKELEGSLQGNAASKTVTYKIDNIDPDYQTIKHIALLWEYNNIPIIKVFLEENIPSSKEVTVTFTNTEEAVLLTEQEFNIINNQFTHCKDLAQKDNRLIAVNTYSNRFDITDEEFDARAYRFKSDGTCFVKDKSGNLTEVTSPDFELDYTHDAINTFNNDLDADYDDYKYQSDGTTLGGEGLNITYEFTTRNTILDKSTVSNFTEAPYIQTSNRSTVIEDFGNDLDYSISDQFKHFKSPFIHSLYGGYMRDEVYRFGINFYDLKGNISFTKWIGDIRIPTLDEIGITSWAGNQLKGNQIGVKFTINIPDTISDKISGYEIVRVERDINNRTIIGGAIFNPLEDDGGDLYDAFNFTVDSSTYAANSPGNFFNFVSPAFLFHESTNDKFKTGDYIQFERHYVAAGYNYTPMLGDVDYLRCFSSLTNDKIKIDVDAMGLYAYQGDGALSEWTSTTDGYGSYINESTGGRKCGKRWIMRADNPGAGYAGGFADVFADINPGVNIIPYMTYRRRLTKQYGGNNYEERSNNSYISTGMYIQSNESNTLDTFGGDSYVNNVDIELTQNFDSASDTYSRAIFFPCESSFNVDLRTGNHFNSARSSTAVIADQYAQEDYYYNPVYLQANTARQIYVAKPFNINLDNEQPYSIWVSERKQNGELEDSWVKFLINNQLEVDGIYGAINAVTNHQGRVYFFQDRATGIVPINERVVTQNQDGIELSLGTGDVISTYGYLSTKIGCIHTSAVVQSDDYLYFIDALSAKFYRLSLDSKQPLSDIKGISSWLYPLIDENLIRTVDSKTSLIPLGIHGVYDNRFNRVLFSINNGIGNLISFNEMINGFESLYDIDVSVLHNNSRRIFMVSGLQSTDVRKNCYQHYQGDYGNFFGSNYESSLELISNAGIPNTKEWNNISWYSECYNDQEEDVPTETFNSITIENEIQSTGIVQLSSNKIKRRFRQWKHAIGRDINSYNSQGRIRNPWIHIKLIKNNESNNRFIIHGINIYYLL